MNLSDDQILRLNAALDGELDALNRLDVERALARDEAQRTEFARLAATREAARRAAEPAPATLRASVLALAARPAPVRIAPPPRRAGAWPLAAALAVGLVAGALGMRLVGEAQRPDPIVQSLVGDFARAAIAGQPFDVASSDRHTVKPWLAARAPLGVEIAELADYPLAGGRMSIAGAAPTPTLVYRHRAHTIAVSEFALAAGLFARTAQASTLDGFHVMRWADAERGYVAVSDIEAAELQAFVAAFRQGLGDRGAP